MKKLFYLLLAMMLIGVSCEDSSKDVDSTPKGVIFADGTEMSADFGSSGGSKSFSFSSDLDWEVTTSADWISVTPSSGTPSVKKFTVKASANDSFEERSGTVTMITTDDRSYTIEVTQAAENETFTINGNGEYEVSAIGGEVEVKVTTNLEYTVEIPAEAKAWLSVADTRAVREETLTFTVAENASFDERSATVELKGADGKVLQSIVFKQKGEEKVFDTDGEGNYVVEAVGGEVEVKVTTNLEYTVEIPAEAKAWLSIADTRAVREEALTFTIAKNETFDERSATVELKGADGKVLQSISFKQKEYEGTIEVDEEYVVDAEGGELEVKLSTDIDFTTSIPEEVKSWISIVETRSMRSESLTFNIAINDDVKERSATINLQNAKGNDVASFVIRQKGGDAVLELKNQYSISNMGGNFEVVVTTNLEYEIEISADATAWLSYVETRALRTDKLIFNATHNEGEAERSGTIKLIGEDNEELQVITVTQRGNIFGFAYTTNDGKPLDPYITEGFGGEFVENIYDAATGCGVLKFAGAVTTIPEQAFAICENLTRIDIPEGITSIGKEAFMGCTALAELTIPSTLTSFDSSAFKNCSFKATINCENVSFSRVGFTEVIIGDNVTTIGAEAFAYCNSLTSVTIGDGVTTIGGSAFAYCNSLTSVTIGDSVTTIGGGAFAYCNSLTSVTIPDSVTTIGEKAFYGCNSLTSVTIPDSVTTIGNYAFYDCKSLKSVYITDIAAWCNISFGVSLKILGSCSSNPLSNGAYLYLNNDRVTDLTIPDSVTAIGSYAFDSCYGLTSVTIPDSVTTIGWGAFYDCSLRSVTIPDSVTWIGDWAFYSCNGLTSVTIPDSVTFIGYEAFRDCSSMQNITIGSGVAGIGTNAFYDCAGKATINCNIRDGNYVEESAYSDVFYGAKFTEVIIGNSVTKIGNYAFYNCGSLTSVTIPDSVTTIGEKAFSGCSSLTSVYITDVAAWCNISFGSSADNPLYRAKALLYLNNELVTELTIPDSVTTIGNYAFYNCGSLTSVTIPDSVTTIGDEAFRGCGNLTSVTIPDSVTTIGVKAFYDCGNLTSVYCKATTPPTLGGSYVFDSNADGRKIYVPEGLLRAYKLADIWSKYADRIVEYDYNSTVTISYTTSDGMPANANGLIVSNSYQNGVGELTYIGKDIIPAGLFRNCGNLTSVTIPDSVTTIGDEAFYSCKSLKSVYITDIAAWCNISFGDQPLSYGADLYLNNELVTDLTIPDSVTTIEDYAFCWCSSLTSITIPDSVTTIGDSAFRYCRRLTSVYCEATTPPSLDESYVFDNNASDRLIYVPAALVEAYWAAENWSSYKSYIVGYDFETGEAFVSQIKYTSTKKFETNDRAFNVAIIYNIWDKTTGEGVITFNGELTTIGSHAFDSSITSVTIPDSVTTIGKEAFYYCKSLKSVTIPDSVTTIGNSAFQYCDSLTSVHITDVAAWCNISFGYQPLSYGADLYLNNELVTDLTIPDSVTTIGEKAFCGCNSLTSITIPDSVTTIGERAFYGCDSLKSVTIGESITTIGKYAFRDCKSLKSVTIGESVTTIGERAFYQCSSLTSVYCKATTPPSLGSDVFVFNSSRRTIYVPAASVEAYKSTWSYYKSDIIGYDF